MTKARSKAQRRRKSITLPGGEIAPQRPTGRDRRHTNQPAEAADKPALAVRARLSGCTVEEARDVLASEDMGRCIMYLIQTPQKRRDLFSVWQSFNAAWHNFAGRCLSITPTPQAAALPMLPEVTETDPTVRADPRSQDERAEAANDRWHEWLGNLMHSLTAPQRHALRGALHGYGAQLWNPDTCKPTDEGILAVQALGILHVVRTT